MKVFSCIYRFVFLSKDSYAFKNSLLFKFPFNSISFPSFPLSPLFYRYFVIYFVSLTRSINMPCAKTNGNEPHS